MKVLITYKAYKETMFDSVHTHNEQAILLSFTSGYASHDKCFLMKKDGTIFSIKVDDIIKGEEMKNG